VNEEKYEEQYTRLESQLKFKVVEGEVRFKSNEVWKGCVAKDKFISFLAGLTMWKVFYTLGITYNIKYHGNPFHGWQD